MANGAKVAVAGIGNVVLTASASGITITLRDVLYVPDMPVSLFSLSTALKHGVHVTWHETKCMIMSKGKVVLEAFKAPDNLFYLDFEDTDDQGTDNHALLTQPAETAQLWHRRFAHLGYANIERLVAGKMVDGINITVDDCKVAAGNTCEPCITAKHHRQPFHSSTTHSSAPLQLLHMDVCGPMPEQSLGGSKYFATVVDGLQQIICGQAKYALNISSTTRLARSVCPSV